jgi:hypothetical protein
MTEGVKRNQNLCKVWPTLPSGADGWSEAESDSATPGQGGSGRCNFVWPAVQRRCSTTL